LALTMRLVCPTTGMFRGLVRMKESEGPHLTVGPRQVTAETPILDWLTTDDDGTYPYVCRAQGDTFNCEGYELSPTGFR
jgi:hypothetical protein